MQHRVDDFGCYSLFLYILGLEDYGDFENLKAQIAVMAVQTNREGEDLKKEYKDFWMDDSLLKAEDSAGMLNLSPVFAMHLVRHLCEDQEGGRRRC